MVLALNILAKENIICIFILSPHIVHNYIINISGTKKIKCCLMSVGTYSPKIVVR